MSTRVEAVGSVSRDRGDDCCAGGTQIARPFSACVNEPNVVEVDRPINSPSLWTDLLAGSGITALSFAQLAPTGGSFSLRVSSAEEDDQIFPLGDLFLFATKTSGRELTALAVMGSGRLFGTLAGR